MTREEMIQAAKAKHSREQLVAQAKTKYAAEQGSSQPSTIQEMPDWLSSSDRLIAKNLSNSDEKQVEFLKQQYPGADVKLVNGQVVLKQPSEKEYRVLDPDTGFFSKDILNDAGDVGYDVASGIGESAATALGGIGGFFAGGGVGAIPGAMIASGASSAGSEAMRQRLGKALGIPQEVDWGDVGISGATGVVSPLLFGTGQAGKSAVKALAKKGLTKEAFEKAGQGVISRGAGKAGQALSGISGDVMDFYKKNYGKVDALDDAGVTDVAKNTYDDITGYINKTKQGAAGEINQSLADAGLGIDIKDAHKSFADRITALRTKPNITDADMAEVKSLEDAYLKYFGNNGNLIDTLQPSDRAFDLQKRLSQLSKWEQNMTPETASMKGSARDAYGAINKSMDTATEGLSSDAKKKYQAVRQFEDYITPKIEGKTDADSYQKTLGFMSGLDKDSKTVMRDRLAKMADSGQLDITDNLDLVNTYNKLGKGPGMSLKQIPAATVGAGLGYYAGAQSGMGQGGAGVGAAAGGLLAGGMASRAAVKKLLKGSNKLDELFSKAPMPVAAPMMNQTAPWMFDYNKED